MVVYRILVYLMVMTAHPQVMTAWIRVLIGISCQNWIIISPLAALKGLRILFSGRLTTNTPILVCHRWQGTFWQSLVSLYLVSNITYSAVLIWCIFLSLISGCWVHFQQRSNSDLSCLNCLSAGSTHVLLYMGYWSKLGYVKLDDLKAAASLPDAKVNETWLDKDWHIIT